MKLYNITGFRKLGFALFLTIIGTFALFFNYATFGEFSGFALGIYGTFGVTNVGEYFGKRHVVKKNIDQTIDN